MKKYRVKIINGIVIVLIFSFIWSGFTSNHVINKKLNDVENWMIREKESYFMNKGLDMAEQLEVVNDEEDAWYRKYRIIAHGGGGINGASYTNSHEAWDESYRRGVRVIDADLKYTDDGVLVLKHQWDDNMEQTEFTMQDSLKNVTRNGDVDLKIPSRKYAKKMDYKSYMNTLIMSRYHPMDLKLMIDYMSTHPDLYVAADAKDNIYDIYDDIVKTAKACGQEDVLNRIIVSIYNEVDYYAVKSIYPFRNIVMRQYINYPHNYYELTKFCVEHDIHVVNISRPYMEDEGIKYLMNHGIHLYVAVIDSVPELKRYKDLGASGVVSSYLTETDWKLVE